MLVLASHFGNQLFASFWGALACLQMISRLAFELRGFDHELIGSGWIATMSDRDLVVVNTTLFTNVPETCRPSPNGDTPAIFGES